MLHILSYLRTVTISSSYFPKSTPFSDRVLTLRKLNFQNYRKEEKEVENIKKIWKVNKNNNEKQINCTFCRVRTIVRYQPVNCLRLSGPPRPLHELLDASC